MRGCGRTGEFIIRWIILLFYSAPTRVLVSGSAGRLSGTGDQISMLLFVLVVDVLAEWLVMFQVTETQGVISDLRSRGTRHRVSHALITWWSLPSLMGILEFFGEASGLTVNFSESATMPIKYCSIGYLDVVVWPLC